MALIGLKQLDSVLSGSLQVSGSAGVTGSLTVGGTLFGPTDDHFDIKSDKDVRLYLDTDDDGTFHKFQVFNEDGDVKFAIASDGKSAIGAAVTSTSLDGLSVTGGITATGHITGSGNISGSATSTGSFGKVEVDRVDASDGIYHSLDADEETYIKFPTGDKIDIVAGGVNFIYAWQKDADVNKLIFNEDNTDTDIVFRGAVGSNNNLLSNFSSNPIVFTTYKYA